jgi:succinate-acetate transporter protein
MNFSLSDTRKIMLDFIFIGLTILFFLIALAYVRGCEKLR